MQYSFLLAPLLSLLSAFRMYLIAAETAVNRRLYKCFVAHSELYWVIVIGQITNHK